MPLFSLKTHGMQMMLSVAGMDVDMEIPSYVWNTHGSLLVRLVHQEVAEEVEEEVEEEEEVDLQHADLNTAW